MGRTPLFLAILAILISLSLGCTKAQAPQATPPPPPPSAAGNPNGPQHHDVKATPPPLDELRSSVVNLVDAKINPFPWPPPTPSASTVLDRRLLDRHKPTNLKDIDAILSPVIDKQGYERRYLSIPNGFALVTRLEQINSDGAPKPEPARWSTTLQRMRDFSLNKILNALFSAEPGFYRIIVFLVTAEPFTQSPTTATESQATKWLTEGLNRLPDEIGTKIPYTANTAVTAFIYEFEVKPAEKDASRAQFSAGRLSGAVHLTKAGLSDF